MYVSTSILKAEGLSFSYGAHPQYPQHAPPLFNNLSFVLPPGVSLICGDESCGKSTLLQLLAGNLSGSGQLHINGVSLQQNKSAYQRQVAWLDLRDTALDNQTARQIFASLPHQHPERDPDALQQTLQTHIDGLSLQPHLDKALYMMSTGTRRKVLLATVLSIQAPVTLLDQPFKALDRPSIQYLLDLLTAAARHPGQAWVVADYEPPEGVCLAEVIELGA